MGKYILILIILLTSVLRFYSLEKVPPSLYWDEASLGYNAYSILKTASDEHGKFLPITNFAAFGDYKPPGYIYFTVPSIAVFSLNDFAIRFPSAFFGTFTILITYFLAKKIFRKEIIALLSAFFLAISPWHLQMSRVAFEANLALFFSVLGIYLFVKFAKDDPTYIFLSALSFLIAIYTFTGQRLFVPLILIILALQFRKQLFANLKFVIPTLLVSAFLFWPLFIFSTKTIEGKLRFNEVTIFNDQKPIQDSIKDRQLDNFSWWANLVHNRRVYFTLDYLHHYLDAFNPSFLFSKGDANPRLSIQEIGELYYFDLILILSGLYFLFKKKQQYRFLIVGWLLISPLGPATARETPHALRMIHILPTFQFISAFGLYSLYNLVKFKKIFMAIPTLLLTVTLIYYLHTYYVHYPPEYSGEWQYGYKQVVSEVQSQYDKVDNIFVTEGLGRPYIYFLLYNHYDPKKFWADSDVEIDQFYFIHVKSFDKYHFGNVNTQQGQPKRSLFIVGAGNLPQGTEKISTVKDLKGTPVFDVGKTN